HDPRRRQQREGRQNSSPAGDVPIFTMELAREGKRHVSNKPAMFPEPLGEDAEIYQALVVGTRDYVIKNGFNKVVLGLSGGIDSALTACVAVDALGKENVVGVLMPSEFSSRGSIEDSEELGKTLGIELLTIPITTVFESYKSSLQLAFKSAKPDVTEENLQARIRG